MKPIQLLKKWIEEPETARLDSDPEIEAIFDESDMVVLEENNIDNVLACHDSKRDLVKVFGKITKPHKLGFLKRLHECRGNFVSNGETLWVSSKDIPDFFEMMKVPNKNYCYQAWILSNNKYSKLYFGEWFERSGKRQKDGKFRTTKYRIRLEALKALDEIFGR